MLQSTQASSPISWRAIADHMWDGKTIQEACELIRIDYSDVMHELNAWPEMKAFLVDVSMVANYRDTELCQQN